MKTIGMVGGMSWQSSADYYRLINENVQRRLGGHNNATSVMVSVNFAEAERMMRNGDWQGITEMLLEAGRTLESAGADLALICTNTMHKCADAVEEGLSIPLLNIIDVTAAEINDALLKRVALLGTRFTMREEFYRQRLARHGIEALPPAAADQEIIDRIIFAELTHGEITDESRNDYLRVIDALKSDGAQGVILGCTEIGLLLQQRDCALPLFDTTRIHARAAVDFALA